MDTTSIAKLAEIRNLLEQKAMENGIASEVAREALASEDVMTFFTDLGHFSCVSGMVGSLIYSQDTQQFFDSHYAEIEALRMRYEDEL